MIYIILGLHITAALSGLGLSVYAFFKPSKKILNALYILLAIIVLSGGYLIITKSAHILAACTEGLAYVGLMLLGIFVSKRKLAAKGF